MKLKGEITTDCVCEMYDEIGESVPAEECRYDCYAEQVADFTDNVLPEWLTHHNLDKDSPVAIAGSGMTWRGVSGGVVRYVSEIVSTLEIDSEFTLRFTCDTETGELVFVRSSHDELGARFEITPIPEPVDN